MISTKLIALASLISVCLPYALSAIPGGSNTYLPPNSGYTYPNPTQGFPSSKPAPTYIPPPSRTPPRPSPTARLPPPPPPASHGPSHHDDHHHEPGMPFDFQYGVNDIESGNDYSHKANSDGDTTRGEYRIALPDGRTQIVRYTADWRNGFNAEVTYEGEARYPDGPAPFVAGGRTGTKGPSGYKY